MALKDWKKSKSKYIRKDKKGFIEIYKSNSIPSRYIVEYRSEYSGRVDFGETHFKTKSQAIKFAKQYMRKH